MTVKSNKEFKAYVLNKLGFKEYKSNNNIGILYTNKENPSSGYLISYKRQDYYDLIIADYTIPENFYLDFDNSELLIRFGLVYKGVTNFQLADGPVSSFTPSSFFVIEKGIKGNQSWKKGEHYHGIEITIHEKYFTEIIKKFFPDAIDFNSIIKNYTYTYLPLEIIDIINQFQSLANKDTLNSIYLEAKILECLAILINEVKKIPENAFVNQINYGNICIGSRLIKLTSSDIESLQKARDILLKQYNNPPSIQSLSKMVYLNEQKLKAGFLKQYHTSIGKYTLQIKMSVAANLLATTDFNVEEIAQKVGYNYSGNFSKAFKKIYGKSPLQFKKSK